MTNSSYLSRHTPFLMSLLHGKCCCIADFLRGPPPFCSRSFNSLVLLLCPPHFPSCCQMTNLLLLLFCQCSPLLFWWLHLLSTTLLLLLNFHVLHSLCHGSCCRWLPLHTLLCFQLLLLVLLSQLCLGSLLARQRWVISRNQGIHLGGCRSPSHQSSANLLATN